MCKVQLSDENKILIDKSMLERYRKYKCCVFIDFEYIERENRKTIVDKASSGFVDILGGGQSRPR